jgi:glycosyltransferase involved in cell wall biosynthesis
VQFLFIGGGVEVSDLKQKAQDMQLPNVRFHGRRPISEIGAILKLADVLFVHLRDDDLFRITIPSKTQAYMAAGRPLLMGVRGDASDLVVRAKAGIACEPENPESIAAAVMKLASLTAPERDEMGANGRAFYEKELSFAIAVDRFEAAFAQAARRR